MKILKLIKKYHLFLIFFLLLILKEPLYQIIHLKNNVYTPLRCAILEDDYNKLLEFSAIDYVYESDYLNTYIIYKDIYDYLDEITIRGGIDQGLNKNPVIYDNTLVGFIDKVNKNTSTVKLITNKNSKVSVKINEEVGLLETYQNNLVVRNISNYSDIKVGDNIYTSGLGNVKENIYIGTVKEIQLDEKKIEKIITVDYRLKIKDIDYVSIYKDNKI